MTTEDKLLKLKKLADAMYYATQYLTTDASRLHKAMDEYHQFIINEYHKEEPVSEELGEYISKLSKQFPEVSFAKLSRIAVRVAKWQMAQMMAKAVDAMIGLPYENKDGGYTHLIDVSRPLPVGNNTIAIIFKED